MQKRLLFKIGYVCKIPWGWGEGYDHLADSLNGRKCDFEGSIPGIINSGKIEGAYFGRVRSIFFLQKSYIMTFLKINFSNFER